MKRSTTIKLDFKVARNSSNITRGNSNNSSEYNHSSKIGGIEPDNENEETEYNNSNQSAAIHYEGGLGGRVRNGEWQVELAPISSDPRDANRNAHMTVTSSTFDSNTTANDAFIEEFPTLQSTGSSGITGMGPITLTNKWVQLNTAPGRKGKKNDFPALMSNKGSKTGGRGGRAADSSSSSNSNSTLSAIQKEYDNMSGDASSTLGFSSSNSRTQTGSLGDWAHIRVDKRKTTKTNTKSAPVGKTATDYTKTAYANVNSVGADYEDALAIALAESMSENHKRSSSASPPPPLPAATTTVAPPIPPVTASSMRSYATPFVPVSSSSAEAYPSLSASSSTNTAANTNTTKTTTQKKKTQKSTASGGWSEALSAMGMSSSSSKAPTKKKLTVIKASTSASSLDRMSQSSPVATPTGDSIAAVSWDNLKPMGRKGADEEEWRPPVRNSNSATTGAKAGGSNSSNSFSMLSADTRDASNAATTTSNRTAGAKKYGGWVKMGGAGKEHGGVSVPTTAVAAPPQNLRDFPSLSGGSTK